MVQVVVLQAGQLAMSSSMNRGPSATDWRVAVDSVEGIHLLLLVFEPEDKFFSQGFGVVIDSKLKATTAGWEARIILQACLNQPLQILNAVPMLPTWALDHDVGLELVKAGNTLLGRIAKGWLWNRCTLNA